MKICHVVYAEYPADPRVHREVFALREAGHEVDVICLRSQDEAREQIVDGIRIHRVPLGARRGRRGRYLYQYLQFLLLSTRLLHALHRRRRFSVVHVHSLPDFQVFCAFLLKIRGVRVILDLHEAFPEILAARFHLKPGSVHLSLALLAERISCWIADEVITSNEAIRDLVVLRTDRLEGITVVMNSPDLRTSEPCDPVMLRAHLGLDERPAIVYVGGINPERDIPTLLRAVSLLRDQVPIQLVIVGYGDLDYVESLKTLANELDVGVRFLPRIPQAAVMSYLSVSNIGVVSYEDNPLTRVAVPTKAFEYAAAGKPMVIPRLQALRALFVDAAEFYDPGDPQSLAAAIHHLLEDEMRARELASQARAVLQSFSWETMRWRLLSVYDRLKVRS